MRRSNRVRSRTVTDDENRQPTHESLRQVLLQMIRSLGGACIIGALNECQTRTGSRND